MVGGTPPALVADEAEKPVTDWLPTDREGDCAGEGWPLLLERGNDTESWLDSGDSDCEGESEGIGIRRWPSRNDVAALETPSEAPPPPMVAGEVSSARRLREEGAGKRGTAAEGGALRDVAEEGPTWDRVDLNVGVDLGSCNIASNAKQL